MPALIHREVGQAAHGRRQLAAVAVVDEQSPYRASTIKALAAEGYRVVAPDQVGFGKSSKPGSYQFSFQREGAGAEGGRRADG